MLAAAALGAAVFAVLLGLTAVSSSAAVPSGFVTRSGTHLELEGEPYRFTGMNIYNANNATGCWYQMASGQTLEDSLVAISPSGGPKVIRAWFFQALSTVGGQRDWSGFDHTLSVAASRGVKVVVTLENQWNHCSGVDGGRGVFKDRAWYDSGYTDVDPGLLQSYRDYVAAIVARYKDDPTILAWQLMNEAETADWYTEDANGKLVVGPCSADAGAVLRTWAQNVSGLVKSIDPNHLVSIGTIGSGQCGAGSREEYRDLHSVPTVDLCEFHDYDSPADPMPGDEWNGLQDRINQCNTLSKPLFVGETGIRLDQAEGSVQKRADFFAAKFAAQFAAGVVGILAWNWNKDGPSPAHDIGPGDPVLSLLDAYRDGSSGSGFVTTTLSPVARSPSIHVDSAGNVTAFMISGAYPNWRDMSWEHAPGGQWPLTPTPLSPAGIVEGSLAVNSAGAAVVVWGNGSLMQGSYRPAGGVWSPTETVANTGGPYSHVRIAMDDAGNVAVAWYRLTSTSTALVEVALRSVLSGWLPVDTMPPGGRGVNVSPDVAFEHTGDVVLVWGSLTPAPSYQQFLASTRSMTSTWTAPVEISPPATSAHNIHVSSNRLGTVVATWHDVTSVRAAVRTGGVWGPADVLASPAGIGSLAEEGRATVDSLGNVTAVWSRYDGAKWRVETASRPAGAAWQLPATTLSLDAHSQADPFVAGNAAGAAVATWRQSDGTNVRIASAVRPAGGNWPASPTFMSTIGTDAESASAVIDGTGLAAAIWIEGGYQGVAKVALSDRAPPPDADRDRVADAVDNCPSTANADQANLDGDGLGDACDPDSDGNGIPNVIDVVGAALPTFSDGVPPSAGSGSRGVITATNGLTVTVEDLSPGGVRITTTGSGGPATIVPCGLEMMISFGVGSFDMACGSVTITVGSGGPVSVISGPTTISIPNSVTVTLDRTSSTAPTTVTDISGGQVSVINGGVTVPVGAGTPSTTFPVTTTSLCKLTVDYVQGSGKYAAATVKQKAEANALTTASCNILAAITPTLTAKKKASLIGSYRTSVATLVQRGWLSQPQADTLNALANTL